MLGLGVGFYKLGGDRGGSPWNPKQIAGLELWLRNGWGVTAGQWDDSSGNDNHATQSTEGNQARVSGGGLDFDGGSSHYYDLTSKITVSTNHNFLVAMVVTISSFDSLNCVLSDGANEFIEFQTNKKIRIKTLDGSSTPSILTQSSADFDVDEKMLIVISRNDGSTGTFNAYKNGSAVADSWSNQANPKGIEFGNLGIRNDNDRPFDGIISEIVVYDFGTNSHTSDELSKLHTYLTSRHGL